MKKILVILLCFPLLFGCGGEAKKTEKPSPFNGTWIGNFTGDDNGEIYVTISTNGSISGTTNTGAPNQDVITGAVTDNGGLSATVGKVSTGAKFEGQLSENSGSGIWNNYGDFLSGTWTVTKQ